MAGFNNSCVHFHSCLTSFFFPSQSIHIHTNTQRVTAAAMKKYETVLVLRPDMADDERDRQLAKLEAFLGTEGAQNVDCSVKGRTRMAYPVNGTFMYRYGYLYGSFLCRDVWSGLQQIRLQNAPTLTCTSTHSHSASYPLTRHHHIPPPLPPQATGRVSTSCSSTQRRARRSRTSRTC